MIICVDAAYGPPQCYQLDNYIYILIHITWPLNILQLIFEANAATEHPQRSNPFEVLDLNNYIQG